MSKKQLKPTDPARFEGNGISYRAKIIGTEDVPEARGDTMCQEMIQTLKTGVKTSGQHKKRVFINVTLEGLKIIDGTSMAALHTHPVHQISFISRDVTDSRAFGYIFGPGDGTHKFFGIKTANAAENLVLALRDLFQTVYEMKKQEMDDAKAKAAAPEGDEAETLNTATAEPVEGQESIYQVPKNNAPVNPQEQEEAVANLLDLEDQVDNILKGIEQIKNLEFDELTSEEAPRQPVTPTSPTPTSPTPTSPAPVPPTPNDPWGSPAPVAAAPSVPASSSLSDLQTLANPPPPSANPFGAMPGFAPAPGAGMGMGAPGFGQPAMGQPRMFAMPGQQPGMPPVLRDPFGNDPFRAQVPPHMMGGAGQTPFPQQQQQQPAFGAAPFAQPRASPVMGAANPFPMGAQPGMQQPGFGGMPQQQGFPAAAPFGMMAPPGGMGMRMQAPPPSQGANLFPQEAPEDNLLQPLKPGGQGPEAPAAPKSDGREALFGDLLDIKKSTGADMAAKSPKEMFQELTTPPKKSLNQIKSGGPAPPASQSASPFGDSFGAPVNGKPTDAQS